MCIMQYPGEARLEDWSILYDNEATLKVYNSANELASAGGT